MTFGPLVVLGAGGTCRDIAEAAEAQGWEVQGFLDDHPSFAGAVVDGKPVLGRLAAARSMAPGTRFINGIGGPATHRIRLSILERIGLPPERWAVVVDPRAAVSRSATLGPGTAVLAQAAIGAGVTIEGQATVLQGAVIGHDGVLALGVFLAAHAVLAGGVSVGASAFLGQGSSVGGGLQIGEGALVGQGAVVTRNVGPMAVVMGNPGREVKAGE